MSDRARLYPGSNLAPVARGYVPKNHFYGSIARWRLVVITQVLDVSIVLIAAALAYGWKPGGPNGMPLRYWVGALAVGALSHFVFFQGQLYAIDALVDEMRAIRSIAIRWTLIFLVLVGLGGLIHHPGLGTRLWFGIFYIAGVAGFVVERMALAAVARDWIARGNHTHALAIVGCNELAECLIALIGKNPFGIKVVGIFDDQVSDHASAIQGVPKLGGISDLLEYAKCDAFDTVIIALPLTATDRINAVISKLRVQPLRIRILPGTIGLKWPRQLRPIRGELPGIQLISVADQPISEIALFVKDVFDRIASALGLIVIFPVMLFCAAGIAISSPGPIFFRQKRIGYKGRSFDIIKFRTMHATGHSGIKLTERNDIRVFSFGKFLRKTSLDELPQLFNVLKGDMSLVGPRPHMPEARAAGLLYFDATNEYASRHRVKPGITGLAQINGWRGPTETIEQIRRRVEHDIYYIENWSLVLDFTILIKTIFVGFTGTNAF